MKKRLNILFTVAWYPNRMQPGDGVFVEKHAKSLAVNHDVNVLMVKTDPSVDSTFQIDKEIDESGNLRIYRVYVPKVKKEVPVYTQLKRFYHYLRGSLAGYQMILKDSGRPDISHINVLTRAGLLPYILKKKYNIPYIITEHWSRYERNDFPGSCIQHYLTKKIVASASFVAPVSMNLQKAMIGKGLINDNYVIVNNVVDTDVFVCKNGEEDSYSVIKKDILYSKQGDASS